MFESKPEGCQEFSHMNRCLGRACSRCKDPQGRQSLRFCQRSLKEAGMALSERDRKIDEAEGARLCTAFVL